MSKKTFGTTVLVCLISFSVFYWWASNRVWLPSELEQSILVNDSLSTRNGTLKSLNGDIFLMGGSDDKPQYLISVNKQEINLISRDYDFIDLGVVLLTRQPLAYSNSANIRIKLDTDLIVKKGFVEFTGVRGERWHVLME